LPTTSSRSRRPRTCPGTVRPSRFGSDDEPTAAGAVAGGAARHRALWRPAARRPGPPQRQREPLPAVPRPSSRTSSAPWPRPRRDLNRYPDREFVAPARGAGEVPRTTA
jgi:hypothetical protein